MKHRIKDNNSNIELVWSLEEDEGTIFLCIENANDKSAGKRDVVSIRGDVLSFVPVTGLKNTSVPNKERICKKYEINIVNTATQKFSGIKLLGY